MGIRRVCLALILIGWAVTGAALVRGEGNPAGAGLVFVLVSTPLIALGTLGFLVMVVLAIRAGQKDVRSRSPAGEPVSVGYRVGWAVGALLLTPQLVPAGLLLTFALSPPGGGVRLQELMPGGIDPALFVAVTGFLGLLGLLLATAEPPGHGVPATAPAESTKADVAYSAKLEQRRARTGHDIRAAEQSADVLVSEGNIAAAVSRLQGVLARLGEHHPESARLTEKVRGLQERMPSDQTPA